MRRAFFLFFFFCMLQGGSSTLDALSRQITTEGSRDASESGKEGKN